MRVGIDLLWVRPGENGGTESYIRNLLDGFLMYAPDNYQFYLYVSMSNVESFEHYFSNEKYRKCLCNVDTSSLWKRILWENFQLSRMGIKDQIELWFMPVYSRPFLMSKKIKIITVIHDIQGLHFPSYFSKARNLFFRLSWWWDCKTSAAIITISEFCKRDIMKFYNIKDENITFIYNPIPINSNKIAFENLKFRYGIEDMKYYYTVSSLAMHKNLITVLKAMVLLKESGGISKKLVITGAKVNVESVIDHYIRENDLERDVIFTGYISNEERDCLYDHCAVFLFPSVFEGFGMPPIEAIQRGVPVITTKETSLYEVTEGKAIYVEDPFDEYEWKEKIINESGKRWKPCVYEQYKTENVIEKYIKTFERVKNQTDN